MDGPQKWKILRLHVEDGIPLASLARETGVGERTLSRWHSLYRTGGISALERAQRADAGLLITEATQISADAQGYQDTPGIYSQAQIDGWRQVTEAVHAKGGRIFAQLWHVGRISHVDLQPGGAAPVAPSAIRAGSKTFVNNAFVEVSEPRALELAEIPGIIEAFRKGAANAIAAGFDGIEIHGANGYLLEQFIKDGANKRTDAYGGSIENRARLLEEITDAVIGVWGADRVGVLPTERTAVLGRQGFGQHEQAVGEVRERQRGRDPERQARIDGAEQAADRAWRAGAISYMEWAMLQDQRVQARSRQLQAALDAQTALIEIQRLTGQPVVAAAGNAPHSDNTP